MLVTCASCWGQRNVDGYTGAGRLQIASRTRHGTYRAADAALMTKKGEKRNGDCAVPVASQRSTAVFVM